MEDEPDSRHELFRAACGHARWTITELWVQYLAFGGIHDLFAVQAYLHGMTVLAPTQQDILAHAINERLDDLCAAAKVPYLHISAARPPDRNPLDVLDALVQRATREPTDPEV